jgi:hypothetical protein
MQQNVVKVNKQFVKIELCQSAARFQVFIATKIHVELFRAVMPC